MFSIKEQEIYDKHSGLFQRDGDVLRMSPANAPAVPANDNAPA
jgi:hypothetical protein